MAARSNKRVEFIYRDRPPQDITHFRVHPTAKMIVYYAFAHSWKVEDEKLNKGLE